MQEFQENIKRSTAAFLLENSFDGIIVLKNESVEFINNRFVQLSGFEAREIILGEFDLDIILPEEISSKIGRMKGGEEKGPFSTTIRTKNGNTTPVDIKLWMDRSEETRIITIRPILDEERLRTFLLESEGKFKNLVEDLPGIIFLYDQYPDGKRKRHFYGQPLDQILGEMDGIKVGESIDSFFQMIPQEDMQRLQKEAQQAQVTGDILDMEYRLVLDNGKTKWVRSISRSKPIKDGIIRWQGVILDITDRKDIEERSRIEKERSEFYLDLLTHDLGNMHQGVASWLEMGMFQIDNPERRNMAFEQALGLVKSSMKMVRNLLLLNRIKERTPHLEVIKVKSLIEEAYKEVEGIFYQKDIKFELIDQAPWATVEAEPLLKEAFFNLIHNGVKFQTEDEVTIRIKIMENEDNMIRIEIEDHGPGIPDRIKEMVFDRLFHASRKAQSGIGLSLVKELISRYDGEIRVEDRIQGDHDKGTRFIVLMKKA